MLRRPEEHPTLQLAKRHQRHAAASQPYRRATVTEANVQRRHDYPRHRHPPTTCFVDPKNVLPSTCETPPPTTRRGFATLSETLSFDTHRLRRRRHPRPRHARPRNHNNNDVGEEVSRSTTTTAPAISGYVHKEISITDGTGMSHPLTTLACHTSTVPTTRSEKIHYTIREDPQHDPRRSTAAGANVPRSRYTLDCTTSSSRRVPGGSVIGLRMIS